MKSFVKEAVTVAVMVMLAVTAFLMGGVVTQAGFAQSGNPVVHPMPTPDPHP